MEPKEIHCNSRLCDAVNKSEVCCTLTLSLPACVTHAQEESTNCRSNRGRTKRHTKSARSKTQLKSLLGGLLRPDEVFAVMLKFSVWLLMGARLRSMLFNGRGERKHLSRSIAN